MSIIKAALSGDNHTNTPHRIEEAHRVHEWILEDAKRRGVHFFGFAGDWNEVPPNEQDQAWSRDFLGRCADVAPVVMIYGNHDPAGSLAEFVHGSEFTYPITVVDQPSVLEVHTANKGELLAVACVPFVWKAHLLAQLGPISAEESDHLVQVALSDIFRGLGVKARALGLPTIALIHGKWRGSKLNEEQPNRPLGMEIPIEDIAMIGTDFVDCAHIHLAQDAPVDGLARICTPSSPYFIDYGEGRHEKGYLWVEIDTDIVPVEPGGQVKWQRVPTPVAPMILLEYKWEEGMFVRASDGEQLHEAHVYAEGADLRFRYHYSKDASVQAKSAAAEVETSLLAQGAIKVKLDPVPIPTESARSLEIVKASTLTEQAQLLWKKWDLKLSTEEERILTERVEEIQAECGFGQRLTLDAGIHIKSTRMKGWRCFPDEVKIDFDAIEGDVVAVSGPNGTGKSLFWEIVVPGGLYREVPTHGKIGDHAIARDTFVETNFEYAGKDYTVSQIIDGKTGNGSTSLKIGNTPVFGTETALRSQYDKWATENLPPLSLVTSTTFMPQESKGILGMGATARKSLILKAKGVERYEVLAEAGRKRSGAVSKELDKARGRLDELGIVPWNEETMRAGVAALLTSKGKCETVLSDNETKLLAARRASAAIEKQQAERDALITRREEIASQVTTLRTKRQQIQTRIEVGQELTSQKDTIEKAVSVVAGLERERAAATAPYSKIEEDYAAASVVGERLRTELTGLRKRVEEGVAQDRELTARLAEIETKIKETRAIVADSEQIQAAVVETGDLQASLKVKQEEDGKQRVKEAELAGALRSVRARLDSTTERLNQLRRQQNAALLVVEGKQSVIESVALVKSRNADIETVTVEIARYRAEIEFLQTGLSSSSSTRITKLREGHQDISGGLAEPVARAMRALGDDDDSEAEEQDTPPRLAAAKAEMAKSEEALKQYRRSLDGHVANAARLPEITAAEQTVTETTEALEVFGKEQEYLATEESGVIDQQNALAPEIQQTQSDIAWLNEQIDGLVPLATRNELLATAEAKIEGLLQQALVIDQDRERLTTAGGTLLIDIDRLEEQATENANTLFELMAKKTAILAEVERIEEQAVVLKPVAGKAQELAVALANAEELLHQISGVDAEMETAEHSHDQIERQVDGFVLPDPVNVPAFEKAVTDARALLADIQTQLALAEKELKDAEAKERRRQELTAETKQLEKDIDRWNLVERTCGRDGLIAEAVAAIGDEINERANELLRASGNTKYTIDLKTTKMTKDGKREIEGCPIYVHNSETGEWQEGSTLSPGQRAFVNLPISLTLAEIGCKDSTVKPTIFLDEPTAGLDPIMRVQFVSMMRDVAQKTGAKIFSITHNEELMELADARMHIEGGVITIS